MSNIVPILMMMNHKWTKKELKQSKKLSIILGAFVLVLGLVTAVIANHTEQTGMVIGSIIISAAGLFSFLMGLKSPH